LPAELEEGDFEGVGFPWRGGDIVHCVWRIRGSARVREFHKPAVVGEGDGIYAGEGPAVGFGKVV